MTRLLDIRGSTKSRKPRVKKFTPGHRYRLVKDYHRENWPLIYDAKADDILIFAYKVGGGFVQFYKLPGHEAIIFKAREAFDLLEYGYEVENAE